MEIHTIVIIVITRLLSGFFSGMEIAFVSADRLKFEIDKQKKTITTSIISFLFKNPQQFISTILVGNNIAIVIYGIEMAVVLEEPLASISDNKVVLTLLQTVISTAIVLFTGEFLPKTIFRINPNLWLSIFSIPIWIFYILLYPISKFTTSISMLLLKAFGMKRNEQHSKTFSRADLNYWFQENMEHVEESIDSEVIYFKNALDFSNVKIKDCMIPRNEMVALEDTTTLDELKNKFIESGLSKIIIFHDNIDNILGYIHTSEIFKNAQEWRKHIIPIPIVPETMSANHLMGRLIKEKKSMAVVVDEFGGTAGIVTREDIVEEIVGEIEDEHDNKHLVGKMVNPNEFIFSGRMEIDSINQQFSLDIPESDDYVTIAGYILNKIQNFPMVNDEIVIDDFRIKILKMTSNKIELVDLKKIDDKD